MGRVIPLALSSGGRILIEIDDESGVVRAGTRPGEVLTKVSESVTGVFADIRATAEDALRELIAMNVPPNKIEIEFGVTLSAEASAVIAKASANAAVKVKVSWERETGDTS